MGDPPHVLATPGMAQEDALVQIQALIAAGNYNPGDRLPAEREMTAALGITRTRLRRALEVLERRGEVWRHVGKGTFLAAEGSERVSELSRQVTPVQMMRARLSLEPSLAREAAMNASDEAVARIRLCRDRAREAGSWEEYEARDDVFHRSVAEATGNVLLLSLFNRLNQVRRAVAWNTVVRDSPRPPADHSSFAEHDRIACAVEARDPATAYASMREHLVSVSARLFVDA